MAQRITWLEEKAKKPCHEESMKLEETEEILLAPSVESEREREAVALSLRVRYREGPSYQREGRKGNPG